MDNKRRKKGKRQEPAGVLSLGIREQVILLTADGNDEAEAISELKVIYCRIQVRISEPCSIFSKNYQNCPINRAFIL